MKKISVLLISLLLLNFISAQDTEVGPGPDNPAGNWQPKIKIGLALQGNYLINDGGILGHGFGQFMDYRLSKSLYLSLSLGYAELYDNIPGKKSASFYHHEDLQSHLYNMGVATKYFFTDGKKFKPYLNLGASIFTFTQTNGYQGTYNEAAVFAGIGAEIPVSDKINIITGTNINMSHCEGFTAESNRAPYLDFSLGCSFSFSAPKPKIITPEPVVKMPEDQKQRISDLEQKVKTLEEKLAARQVQKKEPEPEYEDLLYMIKPYDYLLKLSYKYYNDSTKWEDIYDWNKEKLAKKGPNFIYPFVEIQLKNLKKGTLDKLEYDYYEHEVQHGETLWSIARKEYGNPMAWVVIVRDNEENLSKNNHKISTGMKLKLRTQLYNE